jgi:predicted DNA-binding WGR domain protein
MTTETFLLRFQAQLQAWHDAGAWGGQPVKQFADALACIAECMTLAAHKKTRGY